MTYFRIFNEENNCDLYELRVLCNSILFQNQRLPDTQARYVRKEYGNLLISADEKRLETKTTYT